MMLPEAGIVLYTGAIGLIGIGIAGIVIAKNLFRILLALVIAEAGANMLLLLAGFRFDAIAPIINSAMTDVQNIPMVDPVPQAMVLTAIVIGVGIQALALSLVLQVYKNYATLDMRVLSRNLEVDIATQAGIPPASSHESPHTVGAFPATADGIKKSPAVKNQTVSNQAISNTDLLDKGAES